jgi:translation elongation factor EF-1beta
VLLSGIRIGFGLPRLRLDVAVVADEEREMEAEEEEVVVAEIALVVAEGGDRVEDAGVNAS